MNKTPDKGTDMMLDFSQLTLFLSPFLPKLLGAGQHSAGVFADKISGKLAEAAWEKAQAIWKCLGPRVEAKAAAREAATDLVQAPLDTNEKYRNAFEIQLEKLMAQDDALMHQVIALLEKQSSCGQPGKQIVQDVIGSYNQIIGVMEGGTAIFNARSN